MTSGSCAATRRNAFSCPFVSLAVLYIVLVASMIEIIPEIRLITNAVSAPDMAIDDEFGRRV